MADLRAFFAAAPLGSFAGTVYRVCPARYGRNMLSMRGAFLHGARYNIREYFGALYTSLSADTARREMARYYTVPPIGGFVEAAIQVRLSRVADLTNQHLLRKAGMRREELIDDQHHVTQEAGLRAWESGVEGLVAPSAAHSTERNMVLFLDNQEPGWRIEFRSLRPWSR